jgi:Fe-S-cluster containining protein
LESSIPCMKHECVKCCLETRMPLSNLDLNRILKLGYKIEYFTVKMKEGWRLRNDSGRCVFLKERCEIYANRPEGCRLYPLIYDEDREDVKIDPLCPYGCEFKVTKNDVKRLKNLYNEIYTKRK